jgi:hypothetical protein
MCFTGAAAGEQPAAISLPLEESMMEDVMTAPENTPAGSLDAYTQARRLAEQALHEQAMDHPEAADRLGAEALRLDPVAVAEVLAEHDAAHEPDARDRRTADHDVERIVRPLERDSHLPSGASRTPERSRS